VAVAHKAVLRALYALAIGWDMTTKPPEKIRINCAHHFRLDPTGHPSVVQMNLLLTAASAASGSDASDPS